MNSSSPSSRTIDPNTITFENDLSRPIPLEENLSRRVSLHEDNIYQVDGNFDNISPPNSIESAVSLEELYSYFESQVLKKPVGTLNQSLGEEVKKELEIVDPVSIKKEVVEDEEERMIERIVSFHSVVF